MEVLISMLVMVIGVTSVIALFPVGVLRIRQAVLDTRTTIMAQNAKQTILAKQMPNDPALVRLDVRTDIDATTPPAKYHCAVLDYEANNLYAWAVDSTLATAGRYLYGNGDNAGATNDRLALDPSNEFVPQTYTPSESVLNSFPILVDPALYEIAAQETGVTATNPPAIAIAANYSVRTYHNIRIASLAEIHSAPLTPLVLAAAPPLPLGVTAPPPVIGIGAPLSNAAQYRSSYIARWFTSLGDVRFSNGNAVVPLNPTGSAVIQNFQRLDYSAPAPTAERENVYSWAFMIQRPLEFDPDGLHSAANRSVARPGRDFGRAKINVLCFHRRSLTTKAKAITVIEGCIFDGSKKVTLTWPANRARPEIKRNSWICEATIAADSVGGTGAANRQSGIYAAAKRYTYRREFNFYKVVDYSDPIIGANNRIYQEVTIDRPAAGYPVRHPLGDLRPTDSTYVDPSWPIIHGLTVAGAPNKDANGNELPYYNSQTEPASGLSPLQVFYPILIFDGLVEVF